MPNTPELRAEVAGVVAVLDTSREGGTVRHAVWHVAIAPDDAGPRLRGAWVVGSDDELSGLIRTRPVWALSADAESAVANEAGFFLDAAATDAAVGDAIAALDNAFAAEKARTGNNWVTPDWWVSARLAGEDRDTESESDGLIDDELRRRVLRHARSLENLAIAWAQSQSLRTSRHGKAGSRDFLLSEELGGPHPAPLPLVAR